jgi:hypothetical protein
MNNYANNPQTFMNSFHSASRNVFLTSSIGVAMYGFANTFKMGVSVNIIKIISIMVFVFSFVLGVNTLMGFKRYYDILEKNKANLPNYVDLEIWRNYMYLTGIYLAILCVIVLVVLTRLSNRIM